jgi:hypothetical protein
MTTKSLEAFFNREMGCLNKFAANRTGTEKDLPHPVYRGRPMRACTSRITVFPSYSVRPISSIVPKEVGRSILATICLSNVRSSMRVSI